VNALDFNTLCLPHRAKLLVRAAHMSGSKADADDLVQDAYIRAFEMWPDFTVAPGEDPSDRTSAWLSRILHNCFIDTCRRRSRRSELLEEYKMDAEAVASHDLGEDLVEKDRRRAMREIIREGLSRLTRRERDLIERADLQGQTDIEIAAAYDFDRGTSRTGVYRARKKLDVIIRSTRRIREKLREVDDLVDDQLAV
jgi:RNA polymerase sigma-70 factor (ECF subfamily)